MLESNVVRSALIVLGLYVFFLYGPYYFLRNNILWVGPILIILYIILISKGVRPFLKGDVVRYAVYPTFFILEFDKEKTENRYKEWVSDIEIIFFKRSNHYSIVRNYVSQHGYVSFLEDEPKEFFNLLKSIKDRGYEITYIGLIGLLREEYKKKATDQEMNEKDLKVIEDLMENFDSKMEEYDRIIDEGESKSGG